MRACSVCGCALWDTPAGVTCPNGQGGAPSEERPDNDTLERAQLEAHLNALEAHVRAGGQLDAANVLWLIERARGGMWGRWAGRAMADARRHRIALRELVRALVTRAGERWTGSHWRPIIALLEPRVSDDSPPLPDIRRLDVGFRLIEAGELHE